MKTGGVIAIVIGVIAVLYFAFSRGLIGTGGQVVGAGGILAPQPSSNYSGYLAATTAPSVAGILNTTLSGINSGLHSWLSPAAPTPVTGQGASASSPSLAAQPVGPSSSVVAPGVGSVSILSPGTVGPSSYTAPTSLVGPQLDTTISYGSTSGAAFDYAGLAASNAYDPSSGLTDSSLFTS